MGKFKKWFAESILKPRWVVNSSNEMGIRVLGINMWYYKWPDPLIDETGCDAPSSWRYANKREFGETVHSEYGFNHDKRS